MKTNLDILPKDKQEELHRVVEIIREEFKPEMIILFGSHARGNWVEDAYIGEDENYYLNFATKRELQRKKPLKSRISSMAPKNIIPPNWWDR